MNNVNDKRLLIGVLAGGRSTRMGTDKALLKLNRLSLLERTVRTARRTGCEVAVSGRTQPAGWPYPDVSFIQDTIPYQGPLHGIMRLLDRFDCPILAIGCDMPLITVELLNWLIGQAPIRMQDDGLATVNSRKTIQPLLSIYNPEVLGQIDANLNEGRFSVVEVIERGRFGVVTLPTEMESLLYSVDTPGDFDYVERILTEQDAD